MQSSVLPLASHPLLQAKACRGACLRRSFAGSKCSRCGLRSSDGNEPPAPGRYRLHGGIRPPVLQSSREGTRNCMGDERGVPLLACRQLGRWRRLLERRGRWRASVSALFGLRDLSPLSFLESVRTAARSATPGSSRPVRERCIHGPSSGTPSIRPSATFRVLSHWWRSMTVASRASFATSMLPRKPYLPVCRCGSGSNGAAMSRFRREPSGKPARTTRALPLAATGGSSNQGNAKGSAPVNRRAVSQSRSHFKDKINAAPPSLIRRESRDGRC